MADPQPPSLTPVLVNALPVAIGALIGAATSLLTLVVTQRRADREMLLTHLKEERARREAFYEDLRQRFAAALQEGVFPHELTIDIALRAPKEVSSPYRTFIDGDVTDEVNQWNAAADMAIAMKEDLARLDQQIEDLVGSKARK